MPEKFSITVEDYLVFMYILERDGHPIVGAHLAELLAVTPPTVTNTLKRMVRDGLVVQDENRAPHLTQQGREAASTILRRHMLAEWLLSRMISWSKLHQEAHEIEHAISAEVEAALSTELNSPEVCPHGNPLPGHEESVSQWVPLIEMPAGTRAIIRRIHELAEENAELMDYLEDKKISPGQEVQVIESLAFNQTVSVAIGDKLVSLGFAVARFIYGEILSSQET